MTLADNRKQHPNKVSGGMPTLHFPYSSPKPQKGGIIILHFKDDKRHVSDLSKTTQIESSRAGIYSSRFLPLGSNLSTYIRRLGLMNSKLHFSSNIPALSLCCKVLFTRAQVSPERQISHLYTTLNLQGTIRTSVPSAHLCKNWPKWTKL